MNQPEVVSSISEIMQDALAGGYFTAYTILALGFFTANGLWMVVGAVMLGGVLSIGLHLSLRNTDAN